MLELLEKIESLKNSLDKLEIFNKLELIKKEIYSNQELVEKIKKYNELPNNNLRLEIYQYDEIKKYKKIENEINLMILQINQKLGVLTNQRSCHHENN